MIDVHIRTHHVTVPDNLKEYAQKKLGSLDRYLPTLRAVTVEFEYEDTKAAGQRYVVQITANNNGTLLRAEERGAELRATLDQATHVMQNQARRHKDRVYFRKRAGAAREKAPAPPAGEAAGGDEAAGGTLAGKLVRVKSFPVKPMTQEEAVEQMELLGHSFFLFMDAETNGFAVLYRRQDGDYGLIVPEVS